MTRIAILSLNVGGMGMCVRTTNPKTNVGGSPSCHIFLVPITASPIEYTFEHALAISAM